MRRLLASAAFVLLAQLASAAPLVDHACYAPDRGTPYAWFEGARDIQSYFRDDYRAAGCVYLYVRNAGNAPLEAVEFLLDGRPCAELREREQSVIWWRLLPNPLPPGGLGEVAIRLRNALVQPVEVTVRFRGGHSLAHHVRPDPAPLRIETVGFDERMSAPFLVAERLADTPMRLGRVFLDGRDVTQQAELLDAEFSTGICPVQLRLREALEYGSYHIYTVETESGQRVSCCVRTYDGWVPLATYGSEAFEEFARNGANGHFSFRCHSEKALATQARLQMRGASTLGSGLPPEGIRGHHGLLAYLHRDEPDVADYAAEDLPHPLRIGYHAQGLEELQRQWRTLDPRTPSMITIDMTYKPANYFIYGPLADMANCDCYPLMWGDGRPITETREVVETARRAVGPRPLVFTFESGYPEPADPEKREQRRLPRPMFPEEVRLEMLYGIGSGARGLCNYIYCTEHPHGDTWWGTEDLPELWSEIGEVYHSLELVAPLIALAHPARLATSNQEMLWLRTLICGPDALLLVAVNDNYSVERLIFRHKPLKDVEITLPRLPWWEGKSPRVFLVAPGEFVPAVPKDYPFELFLHPVSLDEMRFRVEALDVGQVFLVTTDPSIADRLQRRYERKEHALATRLLEHQRNELSRRAAQRGQMRRIVGLYEQYMVSGEPVGAYSISADAPFWNPKQEQYNAFEFGQNEAGEAPAMGARWKVQISAETAGREHVIYLVHGNWGQPALLTVTAPDGATMLTQELSAPWSGEIEAVAVRFRHEGEYEVTYLQPGAGPKGGRVSHEIYVVPSR
jgi:hypothetical protein